MAKKKLRKKQIFQIGHYSPVRKSLTRNSLPIVCTQVSGLIINHLAVRPELVEGLAANCDTISKGRGSFGWKL